MPPPAPSSALPGRIHGFSFIKFLGKGAFGAVYQRSLLGETPLRGQSVDCSVARRHNFVVAPTPGNGEKVRTRPRACQVRSSGQISCGPGSFIRVQPSVPQHAHRARQQVSATLRHSASSCRMPERPSEAQHPVSRWRRGELKIGTPGCRLRQSGRPSGGTSRPKRLPVNGRRGEGWTLQNRAIRTVEVRCVSDVTSAAKPLLQRARVATCRHVFRIPSPCPPSEAPLTSISLLRASCDTPHGSRSLLQNPCVGAAKTPAAKSLAAIFCSQLRCLSRRCGGGAELLPAC